MVSIIVFSLSICFNTIILIILAYHLRRDKNAVRDKKQISILISILFISYFIVIFSQAYRLVVLLIQSMGIWYLLIKYHLMSFHYDYLSSRIIAGIDDPIFLINTGFKIIFINKKSEELISSEYIKTGDLSLIINENKQLKNMINRLINNKINSFSYRINLFGKNSVDKIPMEAKFSRINDKSGKILGVLIVAKELKCTNILKTDYKITKRQMEIINHLANGHSNSEIAFHLGITENTMKRHITNIYNKLFVNNKIELLNFLRDSNLTTSNQIN